MAIQRYIRPADRCHQRVCPPAGGIPPEQGQIVMVHIPLGMVGALCLKIAIHTGKGYARSK